MSKNGDIVRHLVQQVTRAVPKGGSERDVTTIITKSMWDDWCKATGIPCGTKPGGWNGIVDTNRVYGSETIVVKSPLYAAVSFATATMSKNKNK